VVKGAVFRYVGRLLARRILEEEDDAVDVAERPQLVGVEREELRELYILDAELLDEVREDALMTLADRYTLQLERAIPHPTRSCSTLQTWS
jgi:hypothetical protein